MDAPDLSTLLVLGAGRPGAGFVAREVALGTPPAGALRCSVCGRPYPCDPNKRTPRRDRRTFCGDECRMEARRQTDRASWHRTHPRRERR